MISVTVFRFSFTSSWKMLWVAVGMMLALSALGVWQLHRAAEKQTLLGMYQRQMHHSPSAFPGELAKQYQQVTVHGDSHGSMIFLLDNQHHAHRFGYDVLTPLVLNDGHVVLIDHGWVPGDPSRLTLPDLSGLQQSLDYSGQIYYPATKSIVLGVGIEVKTPTIVVLETLNLTLVSEFLHKTLYPFIIRQSADQNVSFVRDWPIVASSPMRHIGYAIQWFVFALGIGLMYIILHTKRLS